MSDRSLAEDLPHRRPAWDMWDDMIDMLAYNPDLDSDVESLRDKIDKWQVRVAALLDVYDAVINAGHHDWCGFELTGRPDDCNCPRGTADHLAAAD